MNERVFIRLSHTWYANEAADKPPSEILDEIMLSMRDEHGQRNGEVCIRWTSRIGGAARPTPYLHVYEDSWSMLPAMADVMAELTELSRWHTPMPDDVHGLCLRLGVVDVTERTRDVDDAAPRMRG